MHWTVNPVTSQAFVGLLWVCGSAEVARSVGVIGGRERQGRQEGGGTGDPGGDTPSTHAIYVMSLVFGWALFRASFGLWWLRDFTFDFRRNSATFRFFVRTGRWNGGRAFRRF
jgi:hypothetical protein